MPAEVRRVALLPAAGSGSRMGGSLPKQYLDLAGEPIIMHTVRRFIENADIDCVAVVLSADDRYFDAHDWRFAGSRLRVLRCGGDSRAESVRNGLRALAGEFDGQDWVLVHDAARPCLGARLLVDMMIELEDDEVGGILAIPVADTLKRTTDGAHIAETVPRDMLWQAQTPQMLRFGLLHEALERDCGTGITDEASALERLGWQPRLVKGSPRNLKVTYSSDLPLAELILKSEQ